MRPAIFSTENPPYPIDNPETLEYVNALRRRIEVQIDQMEHLAAEVYELKAAAKKLTDEIEKLALDLGIKQGNAGPGWEKVSK
jgi:hypothetical protein